MAAGNSTKHTHTAGHPRKSERTLRRQKQAERKMAAQGFTTLADFLQWKAAKAEQEARLSALVAAATAAQTRSIQQNIPEEEEGLPVEDEMVAPTEPIQVDNTDKDQANLSCIVSGASI